MWTCLTTRFQAEDVQLRGLIVETGKGYLAPNMPNVGSGDILFEHQIMTSPYIPRNLSCLLGFHVVHSSQTIPNPHTLGCGPPQIPQGYLAKCVQTHIMIPGQNRSEGHPAVRKHPHQAKRPR